MKSLAFFIFALFVLFASQLIPFALQLFASLPGGHIFS